MMIPINKPAGITSHDVVDRVRKITGERKVGHAGTLDPFATGVLLVATGSEDTKKLKAVMEGEKEYMASLEFGKESDTGDPEGNIKEVSDKSITLWDLENVLPGFTGEIKQVPPAHSAVLVRGVRAYKLAREGRDIVMPPRFVTVRSIEVLSFSYPKALLKIVCSSGTYVRSLARDIGKTLRVGAYLTALERTRVGNFTIHEAVSLEELVLKEKTA